MHRSAASVWALAAALGSSCPPAGGPTPLLPCGQHKLVAVEATTGHVELWDTVKDRGPLLLGTVPAGSAEELNPLLGELIEASLRKPFRECPPVWISGEWSSEEGHRDVLDIVNRGQEHYFLYHPPVNAR